VRALQPSGLLKSDWERRCRHGDGSAHVRAVLETAELRDNESDLFLNCLASLANFTFYHEQNGHFGNLLFASPLAERLLDLAAATAETEPSAALMLESGAVAYSRSAAAV
jgi:hypothetical protein